MTEKPKEYNLFIKEPIRVLQVLKTVTHEEYVVLSEIASLQSIERGFYMTDESLSLRIGLSADRVGRIIGSLKTKEIVTVVTHRADRFRTERQVRINPAAMPTCGFDEAVAMMRAKREAARDARADARQSRKTAVENRVGIGENTNTVPSTHSADRVGGVGENADTGIGENAGEVSAETPNKYLKEESLTKESKDTVAFGSGSPSAPISEPAQDFSLSDLDSIARLVSFGATQEDAEGMVANRKGRYVNVREVQVIELDARAVGFSVPQAVAWAARNGESTFTRAAYAAKGGLQEGGTPEPEASPNGDELDVIEGLNGGWIPAARETTTEGDVSHV